MDRRQLLAGAAALALPGIARAAGPLETSRVTLGVGGKAVLYYLPLTIAERLGYFKREGLDVEIADLAGGARALQALMGGSTDVGVSSYDSTIRMQAKGQDVRAVIELGRFPGIALAIKADRAGEIKGPADLAGRKIGVSGPGSFVQFFVAYLMRKAGADPKSAVFVGVGTGPGAIAGIVRGELDAMCNAEPIISKLEADRQVVIMADARTEAGTRAIFGASNPAASVYLKQDYIAAHPNTVQALVNAFYRSLRWIEAASPADIANAVPESYFLGDRDLYLRAAAASKESYSRTGIVPMEGRRSALEVLKLFDPEIAQADIDLARTFDERFVRQAETL